MPVRIHPVKIALAARGVTQVELAAAVHISPTTMGQVLNGHQASWPALRHRVAEYLHDDETNLFPEVAEADLTEEARRLAAESRRAHHLPSTVSDIDVLRSIGRTVIKAAS